MIAETDAAAPNTRPNWCVGGAHIKRHAETGINVYNTWISGQFRPADVIHTAHSE
jgi:hypothetical protein